MSSYPTSSSASGIWQLGDIPLYIQDGAWPTPLIGNLGVFAGGLNPARVNVIDYVIITTLGNAIDFGDLSVPLFGVGGLGSSTRGIMAGGGDAANTGVNTIQYITYQSKGNTTNFGTLNSGARVNTPGTFSNSTRGVVGGGEGAAPTYLVTNIIDFVTIATTGNASDFGDLISAGYSFGGTASSTRGVFAGGAVPGKTNVIQYVTIASTGNALDFGDLTTVRSRVNNGQVSSGTRGVFAGGLNVSDLSSNTIDFITIATTGNATDFGDLIADTSSTLGSGSNSTRGVFSGGNIPSNSNVIQYITIASAGNALDFGDLTLGRIYIGGLSNANGALS